jgi:hypothetical protein
MAIRIEREFLQQLSGKSIVNDTSRTLLVYDDINTSIPTTPSDVMVPSTKLVKSQLDTKQNKLNRIVKLANGAESITDNGSDLVIPDSYEISSINEIRDYLYTNKTTSLSLWQRAAGIMKWLVDRIPNLPSDKDKNVLTANTTWSKIKTITPKDDGTGSLVEMLGNGNIDVQVPLNRTIRITDFDTTVIDKGGNINIPSALTLTNSNARDDSNAPSSLKSILQILWQNVKWLLAIITQTNNADTVLAVGSIAGKPSLQQVTSAMIANNTIVNSNISATAAIDPSKLNGYNASNHSTYLSQDGTWTVPYTHPTIDGYKHIPSGGLNGQILRWSNTGTAVWGVDNDTTYSEATANTLGLINLSKNYKFTGVLTVETPSLPS